MLTLYIWAKGSWLPCAVAVVVRFHCNANFRSVSFFTFELVRFAIWCGWMHTYLTRTYDVIMCLHIRTKFIVKVQQNLVTMHERIQRVKYLYLHVDWSMRIILLQLV